MPASISIITLGIKDLSQSIQFYESIGFSRVAYDSNEVAFFEAGGCQLALFPRAALAEDATVDPHGEGFSGITLAQNFDSPKKVDEVLEQAVAAGGKLIKPAQPVFWGGYSGYFADLDGHLWEVACGAEEYAEEK